MFYSKKFFFLFIASPKTGSTSVEMFLQELDPDGERFKIRLPEQVIDESHVKTPSLGHATASEFKQALGPQGWESLSTFGFVRDPIEKIVSTYFFKKQGHVLKTLRTTKGKKRVSVALRSATGIILARLLPFSMWVRLWPMKKCSHYFFDKNQNLIVDYLGSTARLGEDLLLILREIGVDVPVGNPMPHVNKSQHDTVEKYIKSNRMRRYLEKKYQDDVLLYNLVRNEVFKVS